MGVMEELLRYTLHLIVFSVNQKLNTWQIFHMIQTLFSYNIITFSTSASLVLALHDSGLFKGFQCFNTW